MLRHIAKYSRLIGIILFLIIIIKIDWRRTLSLIGKVDILLFIAAVSLFPLFVFLKALRWNILLKGQGVDYPLKSCFMTYLSSNFLGVITPGRVGEFSRVFYLKQERNISYSRGLSSVLMDRFLDILILFVIACTGMLFYFKIYRLVTVLVLFILTVSMILILSNLEKLDSFLRKILYKVNYRKLYRRIKIFSLSLISLNFRTILQSLVITLPGIILYFLICHLLALSLHFSHSVFLIPFSISIANIVSLIPVSISGIGLRDLALILVLGRAGFMPEMALSFSLLFLLYFTGLWTFLGWIAWLIKPVSFRQDILKEDLP
jgi:uncharacterized protein (TIRG00374 family)